MSMLAHYQELPIRLRRAVCIWAAVGLLAASLPAGFADSFGLGAHLGFWCVLLPLLSLVPYLTVGVSPAKTTIPVRRRRAGIQARRRALGARRLAQAA